MTIKKGSVVSLEYTLTSKEGETIDTNVGSDGLEYTHGEGQIVAGLEKALEGLDVGDTKQVTVAPAEGYGDVDAERMIEVPKAKVPEQAHTPGMQLQTVGPDGQTLHAVVSEVKDETVVLDFNHPLAGQTLNFDVKVLGVDDAQ